MTRGPQGEPDGMDLAVVIPAWNERENLELLLPALKEVIEDLGISAEILVIDGGSTDGTRDVAEKKGARVLQQEERGYGGALLAGFQASTASFIVTMDADLSHRPVFLEQLWASRHDAEILIASRYIEGGQFEMGGIRRIFSQTLNRVYGRVLSLPIRDLSSGFRMYQRHVVSRISLVARDFDVLEEILIRVAAAGWKIQEIPFHYMPRGSGSSHVRLFRFAWAFLKTLGRMWALRNSVESADYDFRAFNSPIWLQRYWQRARHRIILQFLDQRDEILDIGCGSSRIIVDLPRAVGFDILHHKLRWLKRRHSKVIQGDCNQLPFSPKQFMTVINSEVIEHIPKATEVFSEMWRVLRPGGVLIVGTPDYGRRLWWILEWIYGVVLPGAYAHEHITHFTRAELRELLQSMGFIVEDCQYVGFCEMIFKVRKPELAEG